MMRMKVSDIGVDVRDAADKQVSMHDTFSAIPVSISGSYDLNIGFDVAVGTHSLGYPPLHQAMLLLHSESKYFILPTLTENPVSSSNYVVWDGVYVNSTQVLNDMADWSVLDPDPECFFVVYEIPLNVNIPATDVDVTASAVGATSSTAGINMSITGQNVRTATDLQLNYKSIQPTANRQAGNLLIHSLTTDTFPATGGVSVITINHNMGYIPLVWWFIGDNSGNWFRVTNASNKSSTRPEMNIRVTTTTAVLTIDFNGSALNPEDFSYSCVIFKNGSF